MKNELENERFKMVERARWRMWQNSEVLSTPIHMADFAIAETAALTEKLRIAEDALTKIRDMDYRGNRHSSADIAQSALKAIGGE